MTDRNNIRIRLLTIILMLAYKGAVVLARLLYFVMITLIKLLSIVIFVCAYNAITKRNSVES